MRLITHSGCHLCEVAEPIVRKAARRYGQNLEVVDMDSDDELVRLYAWRIPVLLGPDDEVMAEGNIGQSEARRAMKELRRRAGSA